MFIVPEFVRQVRTVRIAALVPIGIALILGLIFMQGGGNSQPAALVHTSVAKKPQVLMSPTSRQWSRLPRAVTPARVVAQSPRTYTVRPGDTLASISARVYSASTSWPALWYGNRSKIANPDMIKSGMVLVLGSSTVTATIAKAALNAIPLAPAPPPAAPVTAASDPAPSGPAAQPQPAASAPVTTSSGSSGGWPGGAFGTCVVMRESGGNPNIWNASGHWGLYQFSASTWAAYGGSPAAFGNAGIGAQEQVFMTAIAQGGQSNWAPYDGC